MDEKLLMQDIINLFCEKQGIDKKDADALVRSMFELIEEGLEKDKYVKVKGLGTFKLTEVESRESIHVNTGERIEIQGHTKVSFTPDTSLKELINKPFSHFEPVVLNEGVILENTESDEDVKETVASETVQEAVVETVSEVEEIKEKETVEEEKAIEETVEVQPEEPVKEPIQEPIKEIKEVKAEEVVVKKEKSSYLLQGIIIALVLVILFGFYWLFIRQDETSEVKPVSQIQKEVIPAKVDSILNDTIEKPTQPAVITRIELTPEELRNERVPSLADTLEYQIIGTSTEHTLQSGETIIKISVKHFGSKKFWPYIVKHNVNLIKDPDNIAIGTPIKIPTLVPNK